MAISDQLTLLNNTKTAIKDSINAKGGNITSSTPFADYADEIDNLPSGGGSTHDWSSIGYDSTMAQKCEDAIDDQIEYAEAWKTAHPTYTGGQTKYKGQYYPMVTVNTTSMSSMFDSCYSLTTVPALDTSSVTSMSQMFNNCSSLTTVPALDTSSVTSMNQMFRYCSSLTTVPQLDTSRVTNMYQMFYDCLSLTSIPALDTSSVTSMNSMFSGCQSLTSIPALDTSSVTNMSSMFYGCSSLTTVPALDTSSVTSMNQMFNGCSSLTTVPQLDTSRVTNMDQMFYGCSSLTTVPALDTSSVTSISWIFHQCRNLQSVTFSSTTPPGFGSNVFNNTNNTFKIYVPASAVETWKAASGWSNYASRIYPLTDIATVDGTLYTNADLAITSTTTVTDTDLAKIPSGTSIEFAEGLTEISAGTLSWTNITLPSTFTTLGDSGMIDSTVTTLTMKSTTPPSAFRNNVGGSGLTAIYVPASAVADYKADANWSSFASIIQAIPE